MPVCFHAYLYLSFQIRLILFRNLVKLEKVYRWRPEQIEAYRNYVRKMAAQVRHIPEGERMPALQRYVDEYINGIWGQYVATIRMKARRNRKIRLKKRAVTKTARKMLMWQRVEDFKEVSFLFILSIYIDRFLTLCYSKRSSVT